MGFRDWFDADKQREKLYRQFEAADPTEGWRKQRTSLSGMKGSNLAEQMDNMSMAYHDYAQVYDAKASKYFDSEKIGVGIGMLSGADRARRLQSAINESAKDAGTGNLQAFGAKTGTSHTLDQATATIEKQGRRALLKDMVGHVAGGSGYESMLNSLGLMTADQKALYAGSGVGKFMARNGIRMGGAFAIYTGLTSDDPLTDFTSTIISNYGAQAGWRAGKSAASAIVGNAGSKFVRHGARVLLGGIAGGVGMLMPEVVGAIVKDATSQDSMIKKVAGKSYRQESLVEDRTTRRALTMRQAGLQKLSSSYLNDRGMLLGNEAAILKGVSY